MVWNVNANPELNKLKSAEAIQKTNKQHLIACCIFPLMSRGND